MTASGNNGTSSKSGACMTVRRLGKTLGAEITDIDLSIALAAGQAQAIMEALAAHKVLVFPDQQLDKAQLATLTLSFGPAGEHILQCEANDALAEVTVASNAGPDGKPNGRHTDISTLRWHTDRSFMPRPSVATLFYGVTVPKSGGDTLFADTTAGYAALPEAMKVRIDDLWALHWIGYSRDERNGGLGGITQAELDKAPPVRHPLARPHEVTGKKALFCGCHAWRVEGLDEAPGRELLDELVAHTTQEQFIYRHQWRRNDLVMWDNRGTLHAGTQFAGDKELRVMYRTIVDSEAAD